MVCSFCKRDGHRCNKCPIKDKILDETDLQHITFFDFFKSIIVCSLSYDCEKNYEYLMNKYVVHHNYEVKENENVMKVDVCILNYYRKSIDNEVEEENTYHTLFIILPVQYNKTEIVLKNVKDSFEYETMSMMASTEYIIENLSWI
jgi:hypothetical protein